MHFPGKSFPKTRSRTCPEWVEWPRFKTTDGDASMRTELYWVQGNNSGRLAVMPRPRGGDWLEEEIRSWRQAGVDVVVSLLTADEIADLSLADEEALCRANDIQFVSFPITDRGVPPSREAASALLAQLAGYLADGKSVAIHCRQGIGRAGLVAAGVLVLVGLDPATAIERVSSARGCPVPETLEQRLWIAQVANSPLTPLPKL